MPEKHLVTPIDVDTASSIKEAVCLHTHKIYDACRDKDCLEDLRVYFTMDGQTIIDQSVSVKCRKAELIWCSLDVECVAFNRGFYSVDVRYFYRVTIEASTGHGRPCEVSGLSVFDKRVILFGSEGNAKIFSSNGYFNIEQIMKALQPTAVIEAVDPICLNVKLVANEPPAAIYGTLLYEVPEFIDELFDNDLQMELGEKTVYCTLGQFSIIRLERDTQLVMPCYDFCMPEKECVGGSDDNPCDLFKRIKFPVDEFFPPVAGDFTDYREMRESMCK